MLSTYVITIKSADLNTYWQVGDKEMKTKMLVLLACSKYIVSLKAQE